jgi:hypothetical protein
VHQVDEPAKPAASYEFSQPQSLLGEARNVNKIRGIKPLSFTTTTCISWLLAVDCHLCLKKTALLDFLLRRLTRRKKWRTSHSNNPPLLLHRNDHRWYTISTRIIGMTCIRFPPHVAQGPLRSPQAQRAATSLTFQFVTEEAPIVVR